MNEPTNKKPIGKMYAHVGSLDLQYEGEIEEYPDFLRIRDFKSGKIIDVQRAALRQVIWQTIPAQPTAQGKEAV